MESVITSLSNELVHALAPVLVAGIMALIGFAIKKVHLSISADTQARLQVIAQQAVLSVEERAAALVAQELRKWTPAEKLNAAISEVLQRLPNVSAEEARSAVNAALPQMGLGAAAGAVALGKAMRTRETTVAK